MTGDGRGHTQYKDHALKTCWSIYLAPAWRGTCCPKPKVNQSLLVSLLQPRNSASSVRARISGRFSCRDHLDLANRVCGIKCSALTYFFLPFTHQEFWGKGIAWEGTIHHISQFFQAFTSIICCHKSPPEKRVLTTRLKHQKSGYTVLS